MAESGTPGERISFRDPFTGRFTTARQAGQLGGFLETFAPGGRLTSREVVAGPLRGVDFVRDDKPNSTLITKTADSGEDWLSFVEPPIDRDITEFRFVVEDEGYDSGFRTTAAFDAEEAPADVADRLGIGGRVVRVVYGISE